MRNLIRAVRAFGFICPPCRRGECQTGTSTCIGCDCPCGDCT